MKIRRFVAADMRSALQLVREAHGADAVILSNRRTDEGIEIVAASSYDEDFVQRAIEDTRRETVATAPEPPSAQAADPAPAPVPAPTPAPAPAVAAASAVAAAPAEAPTPAVAPAPAAVPVASSAPASTAARPALAPSEIWLNSLTGGAATSAEPASPSGQALAACEPPAAPADTPVQPKAKQTALVAPAADAGCIDGPAFAELLAASHPDPAADKGEKAPARPFQPVPVPDLPVAQSDGEMARLREELAQMRQMIERGDIASTDPEVTGVALARRLRTLRIGRGRER